MDQRVKYRLADRAFNRRAVMLSRLDDASEQRREIGICCAGLEEATNARDWPMVERLTKVLLALRESQLKAKKETETLVDRHKFYHTVLEPLLDTIMNRLQEALPDGWEDVVDLIAEDIRRVDPQPQRLLEGPKQ